MLGKLKELAAEAEDDEEIVFDLILQDYSEKSDKSRYHIITNSAIIPVLIYQTGYTSPTIVRSLAKFPEKRIGTIRKFWVRLEKGNLKMTRYGSPSKPASSSGRR